MNTASDTHLKSHFAQTLPLNAHQTLPLRNHTMHLTAPATTTDPALQVPAHSFHLGSDNSRSNSSPVAQDGLPFAEKFASNHMSEPAFLSPLNYAY